MAPRRQAAGWPGLNSEGPHQLRALIVDAGKVQANVNVLRPGPILDILAVLLRQSPEVLLSMTVHRLAPTLVFPEGLSQTASFCDSKTTLKYFARGEFPVCPACLRQDTAPYERLAWSLYSLPACREHRCSLIALCPACRRPLRPERPAVSVCRCGKSLADVEPNCLGAAAMELVETLHTLFVQGASCVPEMSAAALCWWMERLAMAAGKTSAWMLQTRDRLGPYPESRDDSIAWLAAAEMITQWPDRLYEFLDVFQQVPKHRNSSTGMALRFCLLLREAARLEGLGFPTPAQALRQYLLVRYAAGHLNRKVCLFQRPEDRRRLHDRARITQTEAAAVLKLRTGAIPQLIQQGILTGQVQPAGNRGRSVELVLRESVEILGGAHVAHGTIQAGGQVASAAVQAGGQVASAAVTATGRVVEASIQSFGQCFCAFMGYMRERQITARVVAQERQITARVVAQEREITARVVAQETAATARVQAWSAAVIAEAEARTEEVRIQANLVLAVIEDRKSQRESKLVVVRGFMSAYQRWNVMLTDALASRADRMPLNERELLQQHIETLLQRAREMEHAITSIAVTL